MHHSKTQFPSKSIQVSSKIGWDSIPSKSFKVFDQSFLWPLSLSEKSFKNFDNDNRPLLKCAHIYWFNINRKQKIRGKTNRVTKNNFKIVDVIYSIYILITPYIRMLDSDWLIAVIFFLLILEFWNFMKYLKELFPFLRHAISCLPGNNRVVTR